jgi:hypothetical protein
MFASWACHASPAPPCAKDAIASGGPLLEFHFGKSDRIETDGYATELPSLSNPADPRQHFKVLEVWGYIYKGQYRMRFIYAVSPAHDCTLMGQEILEYARHGG